MSNSCKNTWPILLSALTEGESVSLTTLTSPLPPSFVPEQAVVDLHSAVLAWQPPANLGSPLVRYEVINHVLTCLCDLNIKVTWNGASGERSGERLLLVAVETTEVTDLAMGQAYTFHVKVTNKSKA